MIKYKYLLVGSCMSHKSFSDPEEVISLYESGMSMKDLARRFQVAKSTISNTLVRAGVHARTKLDGMKIYHQTHEAAFKGHTHTEEAKERMRGERPSMQGSNHPRYGHKDIAGDKNPNWRGGIGDLTDQGRNTYAHQVWKKKVLEIDSFTCVLCGSQHRKNLITHHIEGWVQTPEKRYDTNNGICLCRTCHASMHMKGAEKYQDFFREHVKLRSL